MASYFNRKVTMTYLIKILLVVFALIPLSAVAEVIYMNDGSTLKGTIKSIKNDEIVISTSFGDVTVSNTKVSRIDYSNEINHDTVQLYNKPARVAQEEQKDVPLNEKPGYWFAMSGLSFVAATYLSNDADSFDAEADRLNAQYPNSNPAFEKMDRTWIYVLYGMSAINAMVGINKLQVNKSTIVGVSTNGRSAFLVAKHQF